MEQALPAFASAWIPPWPVRRACNFVRVSLCKRYTTEGLVTCETGECGLRERTELL